MTDNTHNTIHDAVNEGLEAIGAQPAEAGVKILEQTVVLTVMVGQLGVRRTISTADLTSAIDVVAVEDQDGEPVADTTVRFSTDTETLGVSKSIMDAKVLVDMRHVVSRLKDQLRSMALPQKLLRGGSYMLPLRSVAQAEELVQQAIANYGALTDVLCTDWDELVQAQRERLGPLFNETEYPNAERVRAACYIKTEYTTLDVPGTLQAVNKALYERERARVQREWTNASATIQEALRTAFGELCTRLAGQLGYTDDGRKKRLTSSSLEKLTQFIDTFESRNLVGDTDLKQLVDKARNLLADAGPERLRTDDEMRQQVQAGFAAMADSLQAGGGQRKFVFDAAVEQGEEAVAE